MENLETRIIQILKETERPLTFDEIVKKSGLDKNDVRNVMWKLVQKGIIKAFLREGDNGELKAVYIIL